MATQHPATHTSMPVPAQIHAPITTQHATAPVAWTHPEEPSSDVEDDPHNDPERTRQHKAYKIAQNNHAMALRRVQHGDDVDQGFYGQVNPEPPGVNNDPPETQLMNMQEANAHATDEIKRRKAFNQKYYDGNHAGINEQVRLRQQHVDDYNNKIRRLQNHINNPPPPLPQQEQASTAAHSVAGQGPPGWLNEQENGMEDFDGTHEQDHDPLTIGYDAQPSGAYPNNYEGEGEGEEGYGEENEHDPGQYDGSEDYDEHNLYGP